MQPDATRHPEQRIGGLRWHGGALPWPFWAALAATFIGWFPCDTLATTVGALRLHFHFFDMASVIARPSRLLTGVNRHDGLTLPFGALCLAVIASALAPRLSHHRLARLGPLMPLAFMLVCGAILYAVTSGDTFTVSRDAGSVGNALARFGNALAGRASAVAAQHIGVGLGVWLSLPAAAYIAYGGARGKWRAGYAARLPTPTTTKTNPAAIPTPPTQGGT